MPRFPLIPTIVVLAAVATMIALGFWQLGRLVEKEALIGRYQAAARSSDEVAFPIEDNSDRNWFRRSRLTCGRVLELSTVAGTSAKGEKGLTVRAQCAQGASGIPLVVDLGFNRDIKLPVWEGGVVTGVIAPGPRLIADPPQAGLAPLAKPDPTELPNNHLAYAVQWFLFAVTALVIYVLALKRKQRGG